MAVLPGDERERNAFESHIRKVRPVSGGDSRALTLHKVNFAVNVETYPSIRHVSMQSSNF